jgi:hypothetical protein
VFGFLSSPGKWFKSRDEALLNHLQSLLFSKRFQSSLYSPEDINANSESWTDDQQRAFDAIADGNPVDAAWGDFDDVSEFIRKRHETWKSKQPLRIAQTLLFPDLQ